MTCDQCSHYDEINAYCWLHWREIDSENATVTSCSNDDSIEELEDNYLDEL